MRALLINLLAIAITAGVGVLVVRGMSHDPHLREMYFAAACVLVSAELAVVPLIFAKGSSQAEVSQAGLIATVVHLLASGATGMAASMMLHLPQPFMYWLLAFYWMTLITVCGAVIIAIRKAPPAVGKPAVGTKVGN